MNTALEYAFDVKGWEEINVQFECEEGWQVKRAINAPRSEIELDSEPTFTEEEKQECLEKTKERAEFTAANNSKRDIIWSVAMLIVALPLFFYHWRIIQKEN